MLNYRHNLSRPMELHFQTDRADFSPLHRTLISPLKKSKITVQNKFRPQ